MNLNLSRGVGYALVFGAAILSVWASVRYLLPLVLPFLFSFICAAALEGPVKYLIKAAGLPRSVSSGICVVAALFLVGTLAYFAAQRLIYEAGALREELPVLLENASAAVKRWRIILSSYIDSMPEEVEELSRRAQQSISETLANSPAYLSGKAIDILGAMASAAPSVLLFAVSFVIGIYFISASFPNITAFAVRQLSEEKLDKLRRFISILRDGVGRWFKAQAIMTLIVFVALSAAFAMLGVRYTLLIALVTAVVDALPVFGAGTILLPWAAYMLLVGETAVGVGLAVTYGAVSLLRAMVQAKLLGDSLGLHPLATLVSIYAGFRIWGVLGMIVFPLAAISAKQLNDGGIIKLWKKAEG